MKRLLISTALAVTVAGAAQAETIGVSMALFDDNFLTVLRNGMIAQAEAMDGVDIQVEDAQNDVAKQLDQINNFIAAGVKAIIVNPVDTSATQAMSDAAAKANIDDRTGAAIVEDYETAQLQALKAGLLAAALLALFSLAFTGGLPHESPARDPESGDHDAAGRPVAV